MQQKRSNIYLDKIVDTRNVPEFIKCTLMPSIDSLASPRNEKQKIPLNDTKIKIETIGERITQSIKRFVS